MQINVEMKCQMVYKQVKEEGSGHANRTAFKVEPYILSQVFDSGIHKAIHDGRQYLSTYDGHRTPEQ